MVTYKIDLDITPGGIPKIVHVKQYQTDATLEFKLHTRRGTLNIGNVTDCSIRGTKSDGNGYSASAEEFVVSTNTVRVKLTSQMTAVAGRQPYEITVTDSTGKMITATFYLDVQRAALDGDTISASVIRELTNALDHTDDILQAAQDVSDAADRIEQVESDFEEAVETLVDSTLSVTGKAADSKVTGDSIGDLDRSINSITKSIADGTDVVVDNGVIPFQSGRYKLATEGTTITGVKETSSEFVCASCEIGPGDKITIDGTGSSGLYRLYAFVDSNNTVLDYAASNITGPRVLTAPSDTARIFINILANSSKYYAFLGVKKERQIASELAYERGSYNSVGSTPLKFYDGYYRAVATGSTHSMSIIDDTDTMCAVGECVGGDSVTICGNASSGIKRMFEFVDANGVALWSSSDNLTGVITTTAPSNTAYVFINLLKTSPTPYAYIGTSVNTLINDGVSGKADQTEIEILDGHISSLTDTINVIGGTSFASFVPGYYRIVATGSALTPTVLSDDDMLCAMLPCSDVSAVTIKGDGTSGIYRRWAVTNDSYEVLWTSNNNETGERTFELPSNSAYVFINILKTSTEYYAYAGESIDDRLSALESEMPSADTTLTVPSYYESHMLEKVNTINALSDSVGEVNDTFIFLTDYHWQGNAGNSFALVDYIVRHTGVTKMFFGGDAGRSSPSTDKYEASRLDAAICQRFWDIVPNFYGVLGNHEWNDHQDTAYERERQPNVYTRQGAVNFYLRREQSLAKEMSPEGNYYVDHAGSKIRYFFIQGTGQARVTNQTCEWLIDQLNAVPYGYYVILITHAAFDGWATVDHLSYGDRCRRSVIRLSQVLGGYKERGSGTIEELADYYDSDGTDPYVTGTIPYNFSSAHGEPICIVAGHMHWDYYRKENRVWTILTTTDAYGMNDDTHVTRTAGTISEQAFDVFHIDITNRKIWLTRIGGGSDRDFDF